MDQKQIQRLFQVVKDDTLCDLTNAEFVYQGTGYLIIKQPDLYSPTKAFMYRAFVQLKLDDEQLTRWFELSETHPSFERMLIDVLAFFAEGKQRQVQKYVWQLLKV